MESLFSTLLLVGACPTSPRCDWGRSCRAVPQIRLLYEQLPHQPCGFKTRTSRSQCEEGVHSSGQCSCLLPSKKLPLLGISPESVWCARLDTELC